MLVQSLIHTGGVFNNKDFAKRLKDWSQHGLVALSKPPIGAGRCTQYAINHPTFEQDPVSNHPPIIHTRTEKLEN
jgi:hypothetical protein